MKNAISILQLMKSWYYLKRLICYGTGVTLSSLLLLTIAYFTPRKFSRYSQATCRVTIYISGDWFHSNLVLPVQTEEVDWQDYLNLADIGQDSGNDRRNYQYLSFGWGDRDFYLNTPTLANFQLSIALKAFLMPTESVLHVQGYDQLPDDRPAYRFKAIELNTSHYVELVNYIQNSFIHTDGKVKKIRQSHRYYGSFYAAKGYYGIWQTCNDWVARGLRQANVNTPLWSGLAPSVIRHAETRCQTKTPIKLMNCTLNNRTNLFTP